MTSNAWAALKPVRKAIEQPCPCRVLPSEEPSCCFTAPEPIHEGEGSYEGHN